MTSIQGLPPSAQAFIQSIAPRSPQGQAPATGFVPTSTEPATISAFGKQLNEAHEQLSAIADPAEREQALAGLQTLVQRLAGGDGDNARFVDFMQAIDGIEDDTGEDLAAFITTAATVAEDGLEPDRWLDAYLGLDDSEARSDFVTETGRILDDPTIEDAARPDAFRDFLTAVELTTGNQGS